MWLKLVLQRNELVVRQKQEDSRGGELQEVFEGAAYVRQGLLFARVLSGHFGAPAVTPCLHTALQVPT